EDLLQHEMVVAAFLYRFQRQLERMNVRRHGNILSGFNGQPIGIDHRNFAVVEVHHFVRVFYNWRCVRRQEVFVLSYTDHQGTSLARGYELSGVVEGDYDDRVGTHYVVKGETNCLNQGAVVALLYVFDKMYEYFCVSFAEKRVALVYEIFPQRC